SPSICSRSTPSPRLPPMRTCGWSQARTSMLPLTLEISTLPRGSRGRVSLIGVAAIAGRASDASNAMRKKVEVIGVSLWRGSAKWDALGQGQALGIDALQFFKQESGVGRLRERLANE